ncbi:hypothetical protein PT974_09311 [Cladobotryum mycophilum]|uniref:N-acetyltransferase domain-containing protein n=1 Tax=Cladobotryum mycophilum TaxID=491253 RepID=A0ABR0SGY4_9HYPO
MSLPTSKPAQLSIRSFFQTKTPKYAPPPSSSSTNSNNNNTWSAAPPPPPQPATTFAAPPPAADPLPAPTAITPAPSNIPREASIRPITQADTTPSRAADPATGRFSRVITWAAHDGSGQEPKVVGGIVCRVEPEFSGSDAAGRQVPQALYIQSLCLLSPYRSMGLIAAALDAIVAAAVRDPTVDIDAVTAHVWTENEEGLHWYEARGFKRNGMPIKGYYLKLRPDSAWLVSRPVGASVRSALPSTTPPPPRQGSISSTTAAIMNLPPASNVTDTTGNTRPPLRSAGQSYQKQRPETEWNDLPDDMAPSLLAPPRRNGSEPQSGASSRSSSTGRKKRDRSYPAAAFNG